ncbi:MAG TPA: hypothetical protein VJ208_01150 [Candidatus Nanoarchaeia archaeon]|nr:hypothetical protein [Candidatus Nanoarchaeia archaeon]
MKERLAGNKTNQKNIKSSFISYAMEYDTKKREIHSDKVLNELDKLVIDFINIIEKYANYVIVSGYVSILLGRSRASEDVDFLIQGMKFSDFREMFNSLINRGYECANTSNPRDAYEMLDEHAIRFFKETPVPNIEFKKITNDIQEEAFENKIKVILKEKVLLISPLELQIAYKLYLMAGGNFEEISSDKDFEDAKHIYETFKEKINKDKLHKYVKLFKVEDKFNILKNENF